MNESAHPMELLAPAGGIEQLRYALHFGADAVYVGAERFGLRQRADNFDRAGLIEAVETTHQAGKRIYVTLNALMRDDDLDELAEYAAWLADIGIDAVIISDLGALRVVRGVAPRLRVHVSTQASVTNAQAALQFQELGASRIVLARELPLTRIARLKEEVGDDLELEVFAHGAMCVAYSGRCLISAYLNDRDANRGHCTQPCRWNYALVEKSRPGKFLPIEEDDQGTFLLSSQDLMMLEHLDELRDAGIDSIKIEGRVKGAYYVATVVNAYRQVLDGADPAQFLSEMERVSHRPYHTGFFFDAPAQNYDEVEYTQTHDWVGCVLSCEPEPTPVNGIDEARRSAWRITVKQRNRFWVGDELEVLSPTSSTRVLTVDDLRAESGELVDCASRTTDTYTLRSPFPLEPLDILRRMRDANATQRSD
jgi:putative protease